jgi:mRNA-degrading endonuclease toxin of MazEF toxin-antitoxin module
LELTPGETGIPAVSYLKAHFIQVLEKQSLLERQPRLMSATRMKQLEEMIRRAVDPEAPWPGRGLSGNQKLPPVLG